MGYKPHWIMGKRRFCHLGFITCYLCDGYMDLELATDDDYLYTDIFDHELYSIFCAELGNEHADILDMENGLFSYRHDLFVCESCGHTEEASEIRYYFNGNGYIAGKPEPPSEQKRREHLEYLRRQLEAGQMTLPGFPELQA